MISFHNYTMALPIMVPLENWFDYWPALHVGSGSIIPEVIPDGVLWADANHVMLASSLGEYIKVIGG